MVYCWFEEHSHTQRFPDSVLLLLTGNSLDNIKMKQDLPELRVNMCHRKRALRENSVSLH